MAYKVILQGYDEESTKGTYYIEVHAADVLLMDRKELKTILENPPYILKENIEQAEAEKLQSKLKAVGVLCEIEDVRFDLSKFSLVDD